MLYTLGFIVVAIIIARLIPVDGTSFHEDPAVPDKQRSEVRWIGPDAPRFEVDAQTVLNEFVRIARKDWRVGLVDGSVDEGMVTLLARSTIFGFRDYITVKATDETGGSKLAIYARPRFNIPDRGVNKRRLDRWLGQLEQALAG